MTVISQYGYGENSISCMYTITQIVIEKSPADSPLLDYPNEMTSVTSKSNPLSSNVYDMKTSPIYPYSSWTGIRDEQSDMHVVN